MIAIWKELQKREKKEDPEEEEFWDEDEKDSETDSDDFWDQEGKKPNPQQESDFWDGETGPDGKQDFEIITRDGKNDTKIMGITNRHGEILIPFENWKIISYKNGYAKVEKHIRILKEEKCQLYMGRNDFYYIERRERYRIIEMHEGLVKSNGEWLIKPTKILYFDSFTLQTLHRGGLTIRSKCHSKNYYLDHSKEILSEFEGQGYKIRY